MKTLSAFSALLCLAAAPINAAPSIPHLAKNGQALQLMVDDKPFIALNGELHNSSASSPAYMAPIWDKLASNHVNTIIGVASWELVEPVEGKFDFTAVDDQIRQARAHGMHLMMIWFGAYKNAESRYAPTWVRDDFGRFPRATRGDKLNIPGPFRHFFTGPAVSVFGDQIGKSDARAFAALMRHIREIDVDHTIVFMQVENETGLLGDTRDRSQLAEAAFKGDVPQKLTAYLKAHRDTLTKPVLKAWEAQGSRMTGSWAAVFGTDAVADQIFMAWAFGTYIDKIAKAGAAEYPIPMYTNAWLGPQPIAPVAGMYPSGGPVAGMLDIWKAAAPSIAILAPDTYVDDFAGTMAAYQRPDNAIFIPETRPDVGNLFVALGQYKAISFSPFGIESVPDGADLFKAYDILNGMIPQIATAQAEGRIWGGKLSKEPLPTFQLGGYQVAVLGMPDMRGAFGPGTGTAAEAPNGHALIISTGPGEFLAVGRNVTLNFFKGDQPTEEDTAEEQIYKDGIWTTGRRLNGDEGNMLFPRDELRVVRIRLLRPRS